MPHACSRHGLSRCDACPTALKVRPARPADRPRRQHVGERLLVRIDDLHLRDGRHERAVLRIRPHPLEHACNANGGVHASKRSETRGGPSAANACASDGGEGQRASRTAHNRSRKRRQSARAAAHGATSASAARGWPRRARAGCRRAGCAAKSLLALTLAVERKAACEENACGAAAACALDFPGARTLDDLCRATRARRR